MKAEVKLSGLNGVLDTLQSLPSELVAKRGGIVRYALRRGALVLQRQARANFRAAVAQPGKTGITESTGFTEKQIVVKRKNPEFGVRGEKAIITVNYKEHPSGKLSRAKSRSKGNTNRRARKRTPKPIRSNSIAYMMEYGTSKQAATPWLRPAFAARAQEAIHVAERELIIGLNRIVRKLAARNRGR